MVKDPPTYVGDVRDLDSIFGSGRSPGEGHGNPLQYSCLENPMDRGAWQATAHIVTQSQTQLKQLGTYAYLSDIVVFPTFFNLSLNFAIRRS